MNESRIQTKSFYEAYWAHGATTFAGAKQGYAPNFLRWMAAELGDLAPAAPVLDVGCGDGSFTTELAKFSSAVTALDISAGRIAENTARHPSITFRQHDLAERLPFADRTFAIVWCSEVLEHLLDPAMALREMHRCLQPGGRLLATVPYHGPLKNVLIALFKWDQHFVPTNPHLRFFSRRSLARLAVEAGFGEVQTRTCGMGRPLRDLVVPTNILLEAKRGSIGHYS